MNASRAVPVVCAVIADPAGRLLLAQRPLHKHLGAKWEFPGGKVEAGEDPRDALSREIREELGCTITVGTPLATFIHDYGTVRIEMLPFRCTLTPASTPPHPHEHTALAWVAVNELDAYDLAPADWPIVAALR